MVRSTIQTSDLKPGMVIYRAPEDLIVPEVLTTQKLTKQMKDKHPLLVLSVGPGDK